MNAQTEKQRRFMALFLPVQPRLQRFVRAMTRDAERAKDIVSETILIAFQRFDTLRNDEAFLSFLFTIATRVARRRTSRGYATDLESVDAALLHDPTPSADVAADIGLLLEALERLPLKQREAVLLFEIAGFSTAEVRDVQGGTLVAVRVRLARARKRLAALLGVDEPPPTTPEPSRTDRLPAENEIGADAPLTTIERVLPTELGMEQ